MSLERPIPTKIIELMKANFGGIFKEIYDGDPVYIPQQYLPCLIVDTQTTNVDASKAPTGMVHLEHVITIQAEFDKRADFNKPAKEVFLKAKLEALAEGIDTATGQLGEQTILGILQRNFTLERLASGQNVEINYGLFPRGKDVVTQGVTVTVVVDERRMMSGRI